MIICPICQRPVMDITDKGPVQNDSPNDFHCPTYIKVCEGRRWCHFQRHGQRYDMPGTYSAVIPPFSIIWDTKGKLYIKSLKFEEQVTFNYTAQALVESTIKETENTSYQDFLNAINRFKNLIIFS